MHYILTSGHRRDEHGRPIAGDPTGWAEDLLAKGMWGGNESTPHLCELRAGDRVVVQSADTGFFATAVVQAPARRTRKSLLRDRNCTHEVPLARVRMLAAPVARTERLRRAVSRADGDRPVRRTWANYFRQGIRPISAKVFGLIAG
jgi:hypothetical protein